MLPMTSYAAGFFSAVALAGAALASSLAGAVGGVAVALAVAATRGH